MSLLQNENTADQFEEQLFDIFRNYRVPRDLQSNSKLRKNSTTSYLANDKISSSSLSLNLDQQSTEERESFIDKIQENPPKDYQPTQLNIGSTINTQNDLENQKKQACRQTKGDFQNRLYLKKSKVNSLKSKEQIQYLESQFIKSQRWKSERIKKMSHEVGLSFYQIYKWNWDRRMALKQYHENNKYVDCRYIKIFEVIKYPRNQQELQKSKEEGDDINDYRIFKAGKI
ncbi:UNKNOWN [Stylonychia lemnae]|uniref:Homeobox domain-containing protein n=1 Tax=Stylonychia lemnae TaxID=5949 RepID=A0A078ATC9_STYLE|nr:UNKNOWN [Stylonychia lemnae]|eukprot:CDW84437.1 UNKNOWN [Stylonychia lemnae]